MLESCWNWGVIGKDLEPDNILVELDNVYYAAIKIREESPSAAPMLSYLVRYMYLAPTSSSKFIQLSKLNAKLTDFGTGESPNIIVILVVTYCRVLAVPINEFHPDIMQPFALRAPEDVSGVQG